MALKLVALMLLVYVARLSGSPYTLAPVYNHPSAPAAPVFRAFQTEYG
jgi:hypothetical protein